MSRILHLRHPVGAFHVPRRGRHVRLGLRMETTPVEVAEVPASDTLAVNRTWDGDGLDLHGDALWHSMPVGDLERLANLDLVQVDAAMGKDFMPADHHAELQRSPLLCAVSHGIGGARMMRDGDGSTILHDGSGQAVRDLRDWADANLRLVGDRLLVRKRGPLAVLDETGRRPVYRHVQDAWRNQSGTCVAAAARVREHWAFQRRQGAVALQDALRVTTSGFGRYHGVSTSDDLLLFVNESRVALLASARWLAVHLAEDGTPPPADLGEFVGTLRPGCLRGMLGGIGLGDAQEEAVSIARDAGILAGWSVDLLGMGSPYLERIRAYATEIAIPSLATVPSPEDDVALGGLAP